MAENKSKNDEQKDIEIQVHLTEYQKIRDEVIHWIGSASQSLLISLSSFSVVLPLLFSQANNIPTLILNSFMYILAIVYAVIGMHYATSQYYVNTESNYIHQYLAPNINLKLNTTGNNRVLQAENYQRNARRNVIALYLSSIGSVATSLIILMPSLISLLIAHYLFSLPSTQALQQTSATQFLSPIVSDLSIVAWTFFILSALSQLLVVIYMTPLQKG